MKRLRRILPSCVLLFVFWVLWGATQVQGALDLGTVVVSNISHTFSPSSDHLGTTTDWLIDQSQSSGGGSVLPTITANLDTEETLAIRVSAPAGKKFWVHPVLGNGLYLSLQLYWRAMTNSTWPGYPMGPATVTFGDLSGTTPTLYFNESFYWPGENTFGFHVGANLISNELTFTSITLTGTIPHTNANRGTLTYVPAQYAFLTFNSHPPTLGDLGPAISLIPTNEPINTVVPLGEALDTTNIPWSLIGKVFLPWSGRLFVSHDGIDAVESGAVPDDAAVTLQGKFQGPGTVKWWWKVSSETNQDFLKIFVDGVQQARISGEVGWQERSLHLDQGARVLKWTYAKNWSGAAGRDKGWIDQVRFTPDTNCVFTLSALGGTHDFGAATGTVDVTTSSPCSWSVICTNDWVEALSALTSQGSGRVTYALTRNRTMNARTGFLSIAGRSFRITQAPGPSNVDPGFVQDVLDTRLDRYSFDPRLDYVGQTSVSHDGVDAAQFGPVGHDETTSLHLELDGPGTISFWWKVSSETNLDLFKVFGPFGEERISGEVDWQFRSYRLLPGSNEIIWVYAKDESVSVGNDRGWLDQLQFVPDTSCPVLLSATNRQHGFGAEPGFLDVTLQSNCIWSAWTTSDWIGVNAGVNNTASARLQYALTTNATGLERTGAILIGDQTFTITQSNGVCLSTISPTNVMHGWGQATGTITISAPPYCPLDYSYSAPWIHLRSSTQLNPGLRLEYELDSNFSALPRHGFFRTGDAYCEIVQAGNPSASIPEDHLLGSNVVRSIGHLFQSAPVPGAPGLVSDFLIDQGGTSAGGDMLPNVSVTWGDHDQFTWKLVAPRGMKFVVQPPSGALAHFESGLNWESFGGEAGPPGPVQVQFGGLLGTPPIFTGVATLAPNLGAFGLSFTSAPCTNSFSFTSMLLAGSVSPARSGSRYVTFLPRLDSALKVVYETARPDDPGRFVSLVSGDPALRLSIFTYTRTNGIVLRMVGPRSLTNIVQLSSNLIHWTSISTNLMPNIDCPDCPYVFVSDRAATNAARRFYRAVQK